MKTTVEISDALLTKAKRTAAARGVTLRALVEEGLRRVLRENPESRRFRLRRRSFGGSGRMPESEDWVAVRDQIYRGRGT